MIRLTHKLAEPAPAAATLTLTLEQRSKSRLRVRLDNGLEAGLFLERGGVLRDGDRLASDEGYIVAVRAASELVSRVRGADPRLLARASYHLGNRHVPLQIGEGWLRYPQDPVLDEMVLGLGLGIEIEIEQAPFDPEPGAYHGHEVISHHADQGIGRHHGHQHHD